MSMFDYVKFECDIPDWMRGITEWQTHDTDAQFMTTYRVTADGRLICEASHVEVVPENERPYPNDKGIKGLFGSLRTIPDGDIDCNYHGYLYVIGQRNNYAEFIEARLCFTHGKLENIERVE